jgi:hypothetical protein
MIDGILYHFKTHHIIKVTKINLLKVALSVRPLQQLQYSQTDISEMFRLVHTYKHCRQTVFADRL